MTARQTFRRWGFKMKVRFGTIWGLYCVYTFFGLTIISPAIAAPVNITEDMPYVDIVIKGRTYRIDRIQDNNHKLTNSYAKTSRPCPPFCIHPIKAAEGVTTVGELELIRFLKEKVETGKGVLVDARIPAFYEKGTIPGSVNIPFTLFSQKKNAYLGKIFRVLGATKNIDGTWDFSNVVSLLLYCNGPWCDQSPKAIRALIAAGYPRNKLFYYRGGMQSWQALGLTTIVPKTTN